MAESVCGICDGLGKLAVKRKDRTPDGSLRSVLEEVGCTNCNGTGKVPYDEVMDKFGAGKLKSGSTGKPVKNHDQAVAIMLSEKRKAMAGKKEYQPRKRRSMADTMQEAARKSYA